MRWEVEILQTLESIRNPILTQVMEAISFLAESIFLVILIATIYWCIDKKKATKIGWIVLGSGAINGILKNIFRAPRPFKKGVVTPLRVQTATSYSFPSGHTQAATSFWFVFYRVTKQPLIKWVGLVIVCLTALSRLYLGVHWPVDVIAAIVIGLISVVILDLLYDEEKGFNKWHLLGISIVASGLVLFPVEADLCKTIGALWGLIIGAYYEQNYIKFKVQGDWKVQLTKILVGGIGLIGIYGLVNQIFPDYVMLEMIKYAILLLWISAGAPYLFSKIWNQKDRY